MSRAHLQQGTLSLRLGGRFGAPEAERLYDTVQSCAPLSQLTLDFTDVRDFQDSAFSMLARTLGAGRGAKVVLRGMTLHQSRILKYLGVE